MLKEKLIELGLTEEQANKVLTMAKADIDGNYIPKLRFDEVNTQLKTAKDDIKTRDSQLEELKKVDVDGLNAEIQRLQEENKANTEANEATIKQLKINNAVEKALINAKAKNPKAVRALLELENAELDGDNIKGLDKQIAELIKAEDSAFLFDNAEAANTLTGVKPNNGGGEPPKSTNEMTYSELCAYMEANPNAQI